MTTKERKIGLKDKELVIPDIIPTPTTKFVWVKEMEVQEARQSGWIHEHPIYFSDKFENSFGVGDVVLYNPKWNDSPPFQGRRKMQEGTVKRIFQYGIASSSSPNFIHRLSERKYFVVVDFGSQSPAGLVASTSLEALTCDHVDFSNSRPFKDLENIKLDWEKIPEELESVFEDRLAMTIWVGYRVYHAVSQHGRQELIKSALALAQELRAKPIPKERLALWFKKNMKPNAGIDFSRFIVPYLTGEKEVTFEKNSAPGAKTTG